MPRPVLRPECWDIARSGFGSSIAAASAVLTCDAVAWSTMAFPQPTSHERWNLSTGAAGVVGALLVAVPVAGMPVMQAAYLSSGALSVSLFATVFIAMAIQRRLRLRG